MFIAAIATIVFDSSRLQTGSVWGGSEVLRFQNADKEIDETHRFKIVFRVTGKSEGMWVTERRSDLVGTRIGDTDLPPPPLATPYVTRSLLSPAGFLLDEEPFNVATFKVDRLFSFWLPANNPDEWTADLTTVDPHYAVKAHAVFRSTNKASSPIREYAFTCDAPESPGDLAATGTMRFDVRSGRLLEAKLKVKNAVIPGGTDRADVTLTYTDAPVK